MPDLPDGSATSGRHPDAGPVRGLPHRRGWLYGLLVAVLVAGALTAAFHFLEPTPPRSVVIATGPPGSTYQTFAERYRDRLGADGIELILRPSGGAAENLALLDDPDSDVAVGFVSMGLATPEDSPGVRSLGAMFYEPVWVFYTGSALEQAPPSELRGMRISLGRPGGLAHVVSVRMLELLEVSREENEFLELDETEAARRLRDGSLDIAFFAASAGTPVVEELLGDEGVTLADFIQADAYIARYPALTKLTVPAGVGSLARRLPPEDADILAFTGSLMVKESLHPAIQSLLMDAATEIHGVPDLFHKVGRFPRPETLRIPLSDSADRYYRSGKPFLQRYLPFWMAVLVMQIVAIVLPLLAVVYPILRILPSIFGWAMRRRITRLYGELRMIEVAAAGADDEGTRGELADQLESLDRRVRRLRLPESFAPLIYTLRLHIEVVRGRFAGS